MNHNLKIECQTVPQSGGRKKATIHATYRKSPEELTRYDYEIFEKWIARTTAKKAPGHVNVSIIGVEEDK